MNNLGPGLGTVAKNYAGISDVAKLLLCFTMALGRLEIFTLLVLFSPMFWRNSSGENGPGENGSENMNARDKWNRIYKEDARPGSVAAVLTRHAGLLPQGGRALDIACGTGANARFLADRGMEVDAWDISDVAIKALEGFHPRVHPRAIDISADSLADNKGRARL